MRVLDLFSGIGGISLGLERAGFETVGFCEIDPFCRLVLEKHWPDVPIWGDIRELSAESIPDGIDVIAGGFPCQPHSVAGKRKGRQDDRHLWPEFARLVRGIRPTWVLAENVPGIRTTAADEVIGDLEAEGYTVWPLVVGADEADGRVIHGVQDLHVLLTGQSEDILNTFLLETSKQPFCHFHS